jgi:hypothetical protein
MEIEESTNENKLKNSASHIEMNDAGLSRTHFQWMCDGQFVGFWCHFCQREREKMNVCICFLFIFMFVARQEVLRFISRAIYQQHSDDICQNSRVRDFFFLIVRFAKLRLGNHTTVICCSHKANQLWWQACWSGF